MHVLGRIADAQTRGTNHLAEVRLDDAEQNADQGRFARTVGSDQGHDFTRTDGEVYRLKRVLLPESHAYPTRLDEQRSLREIAGGCGGHRKVLNGMERLALTLCVLTGGGLRGITGIWLTLGLFRESVLCRGELIP